MTKPLWLLTATLSPSIIERRAANNENRRVRFLAMGITCSDRRGGGCRQGLKELGCVEGKNIIIESRSPVVRIMFLFGDFQWSNRT